MLSFVWVLNLVISRRSVDPHHPAREIALNHIYFLVTQIDPAYLLQATTKESDAGQLFTLHNAVAISGVPLEDEDDEARQKVALLQEKLEWLRSLEGR